MRMACPTSYVSSLQQKCYFTDDFYETVTITLNIQVLWDRTPCPQINGASRFTRDCCLSLQGSRVIQSSLTALKTGVPRFSQTLLRIYQSVLSYTPDDLHLQ
jgi:hypothetical protein